MKTNAEILRDELSACVDAVRDGRLPLSVPAVVGDANPEYSHHVPELFIQMSGRTVFETPAMDVELPEGRALVIPANVHHPERVYDGDRPFLNIIVSFHEGSTSVHLGRRNERDRPYVHYRERYNSLEGHRLLQVLEDICFVAERPRPDMHATLDAMFTGFMLRLQHMVTSEPFRRVPKVEQAKHMVDRTYYDPNLSVRTIAERIQCSADYLSNLFFRETGEKLTSYLNRVRLDHAAETLRTTDIPIAEVAWHCGYNDPKYFARLFRRTFTLSPTQYRRGD